MDRLDSRDLQERFEEIENDLEALIEDLEAAEEEKEETAIEDAKQALEEWKDDNQEELDALTALKNYCDGYGWSLGLAFIPEEDFEKHAEETAADLYGEEVRNAHWPFDCIDWEKAAASLRMDYSSIDYQGTTYLFRS